jgi:hypothetical protein
MKANDYTKLAGMFIISVIISLVSCKDDEDTTVMNISLDQDFVSLVVGTSEKLTATVTPSGTDVSNIKWSSSNNDVVTVSEGVISAAGVGKAVINARIGNSTTFCDVVVTPEYVAVAGVTIEQTEYELLAGSKVQMKAVIEPLEATNRKIVWSSSDDNIVSIHAQKGEFTAQALGEAVITATTVDGNKMDVCTVSVVPMIELEQPSNGRILALNPTDANGKITFVWTDVEEITEYEFIIATSTSFESDKIIHSSVLPENTLELSDYAMNELIKTTEDKQVGLFWTVKSKTGSRALGESYSLTLMPDRHEYLRLAESNVPNMQIQKLAGEYQYSITATGAATVNTVPLTGNVHADSLVVSFMYKSNQSLASMNINFKGSDGTALGSAPKAIPQSSDWKELRIFLESLPSGWGNAGDYLQFEFVDAGYTLELNGIHFTKMTLSEEKELYVPEILSIVSYNNQLTMLDQENNYFHFIVTSGDSNAQTAGFTKKLPSGAVILSFEYKSSMELANNFQVFLGPGLAEGKSIRSGRIPASGSWKEYTVDLTSLRDTYDWGDVGHYMRMDFGETPSIGLEMEIRNIHLKYKD